MSYIKKTRIIPVILIKDGYVVLSKKFTRHQIVGLADTILKRFANWNVDEVIILNISRNDNFEKNRTDLKNNFTKDFFHLVNKISKNCFSPLTIGGRVKNLKDFEKLFKLGADKVSINSQAIIFPSIIEDAAKEFGSQAITVSIDYKKTNSNFCEVYINNGTRRSGSVIDIVKRSEDLGAGEILLNSIDRDGVGCGYDTEIIKKVQSLINIPLICLGGAGKFLHFKNCIKKCNPSAVAAANIFQYTENSIYEVHEYLYKNKLNVMENNLRNVFKIV